MVRQIAAPREVPGRTGQTEGHLLHMYGNAACPSAIAQAARNCRPDVNRREVPRLLFADDGAAIHLVRKGQLDLPMLAAARISLSEKNCVGLIVRKVICTSCHRGLKPSA